jgi:hypothetical protein
LVPIEAILGFATGAVVEINVHIAVSNKGRTPATKAAIKIEDLPLSEVSQSAERLSGYGVSNSELYMPEG